MTGVELKMQMMTGHLLLDRGFLDAPKPRGQLRRSLPALYIYEDVNDQPLYIGLTVDWWNRRRQHRSQAWWAEVHHARLYRASVEGGEMTVESEIAERDLILRLQPKYNVEWKLDLQGMRQQRAARNRLNQRHLFRECPEWIGIGSPSGVIVETFYGWQMPLRCAWCSEWSSISSGRKTPDPL